MFGKTSKIWPEKADTRVSVLSLDDAVDLEAAKIAVGNRVALLGNIRPIACQFLSHSTVRNRCNRFR